MPRIDKKLKRSYKVMLGFNEGEYERIKRKADESDRTVTEYVREVMKQKIGDR